MEVYLSQEVHDKLIPEFETLSRELKPRFRSRAQLKTPKPQTLKADGKSVSRLLSSLNPK